MLFSMYRKRKKEKALGTNFGQTLEEINYNCSYYTQDT